MNDYCNKCRVCLESETSGNLIPLFGNNPQIAENILIISAISVSNKLFVVFKLFNTVSFKIDIECKILLPDKICQNCSNALTIAVEFRKLCQNSDKLLKLELLNAYSMTEAPVHILSSLRETTEEEEDFGLHPSNFAESTIDNDEQKGFEVIKVGPPTEKVEARIVCDICGKSVSSSYLQTHRRTHNKEDWGYICRFDNETLYMV